MSIAFGHERDVAIADLLDRALNKGVVLCGEATISLAGVDLIYVGLKVLVASYETVSRIRDRQVSAAPLPDDRGTQ